MKNKIKAILFDLDGTLIDSHNMYYTIWHNIFKQYGKNLTKQEFDSLAGFPYQKILSILLKEKKDILKDSNKMKNICNELMKQALFLIPKKAKPKPFARQVIFELKNKGLKIAIVSANEKNLMKKSIDLLKIQTKIDFFISNKDVKNKKPSPDCYLLARDRFNLKSKNCVVVEDTYIGIEAGKKAKMKVFAIHNGIDLGLIKKANPDYIFDNLLDVKKQILNLIKKE